MTTRAALKQIRQDLSDKDWIGGGFSIDVGPGGASGRVLLRVYHQDASDGGKLMGHAGMRYHLETGNGHRLTRPRKLYR